MKYLKTILVIALVMTVSSAVYAYNPKRANRFSSYKDFTKEFGYSVNLSYLRYQHALSPNLSLHYTRYITNYFGLGLIYDGNYDKYFQNSLSIGINARFIPQLVITVKPGITIKNVNEDVLWLYNFGVSGNYEFDISENIHIGPKLEVAFLQDDVNYLAGFHMGFTF